MSYDKSPRDSRGFPIPEKRWDWEKFLGNLVIGIVVIPGIVVMVFGFWVMCYHLMKVLWGVIP